MQSGTAMNEITLQQLSELRKGSYLLFDVRDEYSISYGTIGGAIANPREAFREELLSKDSLNVLVSKRGAWSAELAEALQKKGYSAVSLKGGYLGWLKHKLAEPQTDGAFAANVERSIQKKFHKELFSKFAGALNEYEMLREGDKVAVCISGGKDSFLMAKLFQELQKHGKFPFELVFLVMDPGYSPDNREAIERNAQNLGIPVTIFKSDIFDAVFTVEKSPCYLCARMRRGHLYSKAKELGCNKIALGHHYDDVIETILMGMLYGGQVQTMMPKLKSTNFEGMELIRPLYFIREADIKRWRDYNDLHFIQCACKFTDSCMEEDIEAHTSSKRAEIKQLIASLKKVNPYVEQNIFKSVQNVNLATVISYKDESGEHKFTDRY